jgi:hypothetical protein
VKDELRLLRHKIFGRRSEQITEEEQRQASLFDEAEWISEQEEQKPPATSIEVSAHRRRKRGRKPLPSDLPREEVLHNLPEEQKICSCRKPFVRIGEETSEKVEIIPQRIKVFSHIRPK